MRCGSPFKSKMAVSGGRGALPKVIRYWYPTRFDLPGITRDEAQAALETVFRLAQLYVPAKFQRADTPSQATIRITLGAAKDFDHEGQTLAMSDVVNLRDSGARRDIWFSPHVEWTTGPVEGNLVNPIPVGAHELGHTLGFGHSRSGLMAPTIDPLITTPTAAEMQAFWQEYPEWLPK